MSLLNLQTPNLAKHTPLLGLRNAFAEDGPFTFQFLGQGRGIIHVYLGSYEKSGQPQAWANGGL